MALALMTLSPVAIANGPVVDVAKTPTCGCCNAWVDHLEEEGFDVRAHNVSHQQLNEIKINLDIGPGQASCHTAMVDGYFIEGHVHAREIQALLETQPDAAGLTVPGMPVGSPGMEVGSRQDPYQTLLVDDEGGTVVYQHHNTGQ
jgi:hypothetical protein